MTWLALLLIGCGVADVLARPKVAQLVPEAIGAAVVVLLGLLAGQTGIGDLLAVTAIAAVVVAWRRTAAAAFERGRTWVPLVVLGGAVALALVLSGLAAPGGGALAGWWGGLGWAWAGTIDAERALLVLGVMLVQLSTANIVVRLVLAATGTVNPARPPALAASDPHDPAHDLKGGRLLGPMERLLIVGLGIAGNLTAASIVVAAKGLLRFPELSSKKEHQEYLHRLTEYFLVGSFVSWTIALASLALLAR